MDDQTIATLLNPFLQRSLSQQQLHQLLTYLELLVKWNGKMNLTSVRKPEEIVLRHFGESLFAGEALLDFLKDRSSLLDLGSGPGFPGLPIKILIPRLKVTLAESQTRKAVFLREVIRSLHLDGIEVHAGRAEDLDKTFDVLTMRAVEQQEAIVPGTPDFLSENGILLLMMGASQVERVKQVLSTLEWADPKMLPLSESRVVAIGKRLS